MENYCYEVRGSRWVWIAASYSLDLGRCEQHAKPDTMNLAHKHPCDYVWYKTKLIICAQNPDKLLHSRPFSVFLYSQRRTTLTAVTLQVMICRPGRRCADPVPQESSGASSTVNRRIERSLNSDLLPIANDPASILWNTDWRTNVIWTHIYIGRKTFFRWYQMPMHLQLFACHYYHNCFGILSVTLLLPIDFINAAQRTDNSQKRASGSKLIATIFCLWLSHLIDTVSCIHWIQQTASMQCTVCVHNFGVSIFTSKGIHNKQVKDMHDKYHNASSSYRWDWSLDWRYFCLPPYSLRWQWDKPNKR